MGEVLAEALAEALAEEWVEALARTAHTEAALEVVSVVAWEVKGDQD